MDLRRETNVFNKAEKHGPIFQDQFKKIMEKCSNLENELKYFKDLSCDLKIKLHMCQMAAEEDKMHLNELKQKLKHFEADNSCNYDSSQNQHPEILNSRITLEMLRVLCEVKKQLQASLFLVLNITNEKNCQEILHDSIISSHHTDWEELTEDILNDIVKLNASLQVKVDKLRGSEASEVSKSVSNEKLVLSTNPTPEMKQLEFKLDEKEFSSLELVDCKLIIAHLKSVIADKRMEVEALKTEHWKKLHESQYLLSEVQAESQVLNRYHSTFQSAIECLTGEWDLQTKYSDSLNKVEVLESKLSLLQQQKDEDQKHQQLVAEFERFEQEVVHLSRQVSSSQDELEGSTAADALNEVSTVRVDDNNLQRSPQQVQIKEKLYENEFLSIIQESDDKIEKLVKLLNASRRSEELLTADIKGMQRITKSLKTSEEYFKRMADELEYKLKASDYEKQIMDNAHGLKAHAQMAQCQCARLEKEEQDKLLCSTSAEFAEQKAEKMIFPNKITHMQSYLHYDKKGLVKMNSDFVIKEAVYAPETSLRNACRKKSVKSGGKFRS